MLEDTHVFRDVLLYCTEGGWAKEYNIRLSKDTMSKDSQQLWHVTATYGRIGNARNMNSLTKEAVTYGNAFEIYEKAKIAKLKKQYKIWNESIG